MPSTITQDQPPQPPKGTVPEDEPGAAGVREEEYLSRDESRLRAGFLLTSRTMARRLPSLVRRSVRMARRVDRGATIGLLVCRIGTGGLAALGLPAVTGTITALISSGDITERLWDAAPQPAVIAAATGCPAPAARRPTPTATTRSSTHRPGTGTGPVSRSSAEPPSPGRPPNASATETTATTGTSSSSTAMATTDTPSRRRSSSRSSTGSSTTAASAAPSSAPRRPAEGSPDAARRHRGEHQCVVRGHLAPRSRRGSPARPGQSGTHGLGTGRDRRGLRRAPNARLRLAARVTAIGPAAVDPATGHPFTRLLAPPPRQPPCWTGARPAPGKPCSRWRRRASGGACPLLAPPPSRRSRWRGCG